MKKILVPTDFSKEAGYALDAAINLASSSGAEVQLLHVRGKLVDAWFVTVDANDRLLTSDADIDNSAKRSTRINKAVNAE